MGMGSLQTQALRRIRPGAGWALDWSAWGLRRGAGGDRRGQDGQGPVQAGPGAMCSGGKERRGREGRPTPGPEDRDGSSPAALRGRAALLAPEFRLLAPGGVGIDFCRSRPLSCGRCDVSPGELPRSAKCRAPRGFP